MRVNWFETRYWWRGRVCHWCQGQHDHLLASMGIEDFDTVPNDSTNGNAYRPCIILDDVVIFSNLQFDCCFHAGILLSPPNSVHIHTWSLEIEALHLLIVCFALCCLSLSIPRITLKWRSSFHLCWRGCFEICLHGSTQIAAMRLVEPTCNQCHYHLGMIKIISHKLHEPVWQMLDELCAIGYYNV